VNFAKPASLIDAGSAFFVKSSEIKSPMNSQVGAFEDYDVMKEYSKSVSGIYLTWGELVTQYK
jgi:copper chaperone NosL